MLIKDLRHCRYFTVGDGTRICEFLHPARDGLELSYSLAHAVLGPGCQSLSHRLIESSEVYFILEGDGEIQIDEEQAQVGPGQLVLIPPGSWQSIRNTGTVDLKFLCIVSPMWRHEDEEVRSDRE